ncbi:MAG: dTDP-4-dehydrorhamnose 3,5-epimerase family protein [Chlamydiia bacterium]|nr:dTDP-4-dehydrorhamnose 3,5-epimerase family protein [Chlamydiia bacterium]
MKFHPLPLSGAYLIEPDHLHDDRGFFSTLFIAEEFKKWNLAHSFPQVNNSLSKKKGTLRGIHYQIPPFAQAKLLRCLSGALLDCLVDLDPHSPTYLKHHLIPLSATSRQLLYLPETFGHAFLTTEDNTELLYFASAPYSPEHELGLPWNDPTLNIAWPSAPTIVSHKDLNYERIGD